MNEIYETERQKFYSKRQNNSWFIASTESKTVMRVMFVLY